MVVGTENSQAYEENYAKWIHSRLFPLDIHYSYRYLDSLKVHILVEL